MIDTDRGTDESAFEVAVLLTIFNRPELTERALRAISVVRPRHLLIAADGPRTDAEAALCSRARAVVESVDWNCQIYTDFAAENMGCGIRVHTAVSWALSIFDSVVVLEDDCVASPSFFAFCEKLLDRYHLDYRVMHIGGFSLLPIASQDIGSYYFSKYSIASGGWATWRRAWCRYDWAISDWPSLEIAGLLEVWCEDRVERDYWKAIFDKCYAGWRDAWDYQWNFALWANSGLAALPTSSLLTNHGYGADATHTFEPIPSLLRPVTELSTVVHPKYVLQNAIVDRAVFDECFGGSQLRRAKLWRVRMRRLVGGVVSPIRRTFSRLWRLMSSS